MPWYQTQTRFLFHTPVKIKISDRYQDIDFNKYYDILADIDKKYNSYSDASYFHLINKYAGKFVEVDDETINILNTVIHLSDYFEGRYDCTVMPLIKLWGFYKKRRKAPSEKEIEKTRRFINYKDIQVNGNHVKINKGQEIITASFIKSYAVECLRQKMMEDGITDAVINAGRSSIAAINDTTHPAWKINVKNEEEHEEMILSIRNQCYSTSEQYSTFTIIGGKTYGHILNPLTGFPAENKKVGIITDNCMRGDIFSTAFFNETAESFLQKMKLLSKEYNIEGFLIDKHRNTVYSKGFSEYIVRNKLNVCTQ